MIGARLLALVLALFAGRPADYEAGRALLDAGRFREALAAFDELANPAERHRGRAEAYWRAGDPARTLVEARAGLASEPGSPELAHRAVAAALWIGDEASAARLLEELRANVAAAGFGPDLRGPWDAAVEEFAREVARREALASERRSALGRARWTSLGGLVAACVGLGLVARARGAG